MYVYWFGFGFMILNYFIKKLRRILLKFLSNFFYMDVVYKFIK